jgi:divalent metal cation (Fe/Co/Zn/Cd) transporter
MSEHLHTDDRVHDHAHGVRDHAHGVRDHAHGVRDHGTDPSRVGGSGVEVRPSAEARRSGVRRALLLNRFSIGYNVAESVIALAAGIAAGSVSLVGFGLDSTIEISASLVLAWRLAAEKRDGCTQRSDRIATRAIAISFAALALYVGIDALGRLARGEAPDPSVVGVVLTSASLVIMPFLARAKKRVAPVLGSRAQVAEADQTRLCAWMSAVVLVGLLANLWLGWWWADPLAALGISALASVEAVRTWRAESLADTCCAQ